MKTIIKVFVNVNIYIIKIYTLIYIMSIKKALLIGINYFNTNNSLRGCINDVENLKSFLIKNGNFENDDIITMTDNIDETSSNYPTRANILNNLTNLVNLSLENPDKQLDLFVSYSGHGYYIADSSNDELDGRDEVWCPVDYSQNGFIVDDEIKNIIKQFKKNANLFVLSDSCNSGTMCDFKYVYDYFDSNLRLQNPLADDTECKCIFISGCFDFQTSADAYIKEYNSSNYEYQGAMTASFLSNFYKNIEFITLIKAMKNWLLWRGFSQRPQLSSGVSLDMNVEKFMF